MNPRVSDEMIDQLVCGSLRGGEYRKAILALEAQPERWRDCALAFLQEQAITQELKQLAATDVNWEIDSKSNSVTVVGTDLVTTTKPSLQNSSLRAWVFRLSSLAALLMVSFGVGWVSSSIRAKSANAEVGQERSTDAALAVNSSGGSATTTPDLKLDNWTVDKVLPNSKSSSNNYSFVGNKYSSLMPIDEEIPANLAKLEREGHIRIEKSTTLMPVEYGEVTVLVPVQQLRVVPVTFSY